MSVKIQFKKKVKQNVVNQDGERLFTRAYEFKRDGKTAILQTSQANKLINKKVDELVKKDKRKVTETSLIQIVYILEWDDYANGKIRRYNEGVYMPSFTNFGSIDIDDEELNRVKGFLINYFV